MNTVWSFLCSLAVALVLFTTVGQSIFCYQCSSVNNTSCANIESSNTSIFYRECNGNYQGRQPFCRKTIQTIIIDKKNIVRVHRSCGWLPDHHNHKPCYKYENDFHYEIVCACDTDGCNSAPKMASRGAWVLLVTVVGVWKVIVG